MKRNRLIVLALMLIGLMNAQKVCAQTSTQRWAGNTPADVYSGTGASRIFYLYNLGTGNMLTKGGKWGTQAVSAKQGMAMQLKSAGSGKYYLQSSVKCQTNNNKNGYVDFMDGTGLTSNHDSLLFYVDQGGVNSDDSGRSTAVMTFSEVTVTGYSNIYRVSCYNNNTDEDDPADATCNGTFYLTDRNGIIAPVNKDTIDNIVDNSDKWILVTQQDFINDFKVAEATEAKPAPAYFVLSDYDFARNDNDISHWMGDSARTTTISNNVPLNNTQKAMNPLVAPKGTETTETVVVTPASYTYTVECYQGTSIYNATSAGSFEYPSSTPYSNITTLNKPTRITNNFIGCKHTHKRNDATRLRYQMVTLTSSNPAVTEERTTTEGGYTYYIGNGYGELTMPTNSTGKYYDTEGNTYDKSNDAFYQKAHGGKWTANIHGKKGSISQKINITLRSGWYKISCDGFSSDSNGYLFASVSGAKSGTTDQRAVAPLTQVSNLPDTYVKASLLLNEMEGVTQSVSVYVPRKENSTTHEPETGSYIILGAFIANGDNNSWVCVDNFNIEYLGDPDTDIIIDENQTDYDYINGQVDTEGNHTMRLYRTFKTDNWNSLVLPVNLTAGQVKTAFGGDTKLSVLQGATAEAPNRIYFTKVDLTDNDAVAINAGKLYIIKPQVEMTTLPDESKAVTRKVTIGGKTFNLSLRTYYTFNQVVLNTVLESGNVKSSVVQGATDEGGLQMVGTYVKKGKDVTEGTTAIPVNSYILGTQKNATDSKWYYTTVAVNNVKGLRGWLETGKSAPNTDVKFFINGVEEGEVTAIEGIESSMEVSKRINSNIYNLNGQLVRSNSVSAEGLDKGIYIIGGKKVVVK